MKYILKMYDENLVWFQMAIHPLNGLQIEIERVAEGREQILPLDLEMTGEGMVKWLQKRVIPKNRAFVHEILKSLNLSQNDTKGIIDICKGLSLNDSYWIVPENFEGKYAEYNLYQNKFNRILSLVAYTGIADSSTNFTSSPELTTNGNLPKG